MLFRRISQHIKDQNWTAVGLDSLIVIVGVFLGLQAQDWNQSRQENTALQSYLSSMSRNIEFDLDRLKSLQEKRSNVLNSTNYLISNAYVTEFIDRPAVQIASDAYKNLSDNESFNADQTAFDTFKQSGLLRNIQGQDLEDLIFRYYNLAEEVASQEAVYNQALNDYLSKLSNEGFEAMGYVMYPLYMSDEQLIEQQSQIRTIFEHPSTISLYSHAFLHTSELIIRYENLTRLGEEIVHVIRNGSRSMDISTPDVLDALYRIDGDKGYPKIIPNGVVMNRFYEAGFEDANSEGFTLSYGLTEISLKAPNSDWAVFYLRHRSNAFADRPSKDFSGFKSITLTLKGAIGGEEVFVSMKDGTDADDGLESKYALTVSQDWETYTIPLSVFETADLTDIFVPVQLIFYGGGDGISVRDIEFQS